MVSTGTTTTATATALLLLLVASAHAATGIADLFSWSLDYIGSEAKSGETEPSPSLATRDCSCDGPTCNCCVNFNISFIDLGGPGCVKLKYLSQAEGLMVNVSYGDNVLHSEQVKGSKPQPACMDLLSNLAQVCARFSELTTEGEGLRGCTLLEPTLLGDVQAQYPVGCFRMGPFGMVLDTEREPVIAPAEEQTAGEAESEDEDEEEESATDKPSASEEALINAVNESAEEGIAWFTSLLGISFGGSNNTEAAEAADTAPAATTPQQQRSFNAITLE